MSIAPRSRVMLFEEIGRNPIQRHPQVVENHPGKKKSAHPEHSPQGSAGTSRARVLASFDASCADHPALVLDHTLAAVIAAALGTADPGFPIGVMPAALMNQRSRHIAEPRSTHAVIRPITPATVLQLAAKTTPLNRKPDIESIGLMAPLVRRLASIIVPIHDPRLRAS